MSQAGSRRTEPAPGVRGRARGQPPDVTGLLGFRLFRLSNTLGLAAERRYIREFGVSLADWRCLSVIASRDGCTVGEVCAHLGIDKAWVSRTFARLAARGLIDGARDPSDARRVVHRATRRGRDVSARILEAAQARHRWLLQEFGPGEVAVLDRALATLQRRAQALLDDSPGRA
jgi:DNA-binding MarR family transcriptional regulator